MMSDNNIPTGRADWTFEKPTCDVFDDHVRKSIPLYDEFHDVACKLCDWYVKPNGTVLDLGVSTGTFIKRLNDRHRDKKLNFNGLDYSRGMIDLAYDKLHKEGNEKISLYNADFEDSHFHIANYVPYDSVDVVICMFTLQFLTWETKKKIIKQVYDSLRPEGAFIIADKFHMPIWENQCNDLYEEFKLDSGLTTENVIAKRQSLRGVQKPYPWLQLDEVLENVGFKKPALSFLSYLNFIGFIYEK